MERFISIIGRPAAGRVRRLEIPDPTEGTGRFRVSDTLFPMTARRVVQWPKRFADFRLDSLYSLSAGDYHEASRLPRGRTPLVSWGDAKNGIMAFVDVRPEHLHYHRLTIAFNGMNTLTAKYHHYSFAAKDDVVICHPLKPMRR